MQTKTSLTVVRGAPPKADFVFLSTDVNGTPGELNQYVLKELQLPPSVLPRRDQLVRGFAIRPVEPATLVFVVTVDGGPVGDNLTANLTNAMAQLSIADGSSLWIPLMGTGTGGLSNLASLTATLIAIENVSSLRGSGAQINIALPASLSASEFATLREFAKGRSTFFSDAAKGGSSASSSADGAGGSAIPESAGRVYGADCLALFEVAKELSFLRIAPSSFLSTTLLLFAISRADRTDAPHALAQSAEARAFAGMLKDLAGPAFQTSWDRYFQVKSIEPGHPIVLDGFTENCERWLEGAAEHARRNGRTAVSVADVIAAFWQRRNGQAWAMLAEMKVPLARFLAEYERRLLLAAAPVHIVADIYDHLLHDHATNLDLMDFNQYAIAISNFLTSPETRGPISISIQAPWGAGKSSLMHQVRHILDANARVPRERGHATIWNVLRFLNQKRTPDATALSQMGTSNAAKEKNEESPRETRWTIWFNAWKYESSEQVWAGLVDAIMSQVSDRLSPVERELFLLRLNLARIDDGEVRKKIYDRVAQFWWVGARWLLLVGAAAVSAVWALSAGGPAMLATLTAGGVSLMCWLGRAWYKVWDEPATFSLAEYVRVPDYGKSVGIVHQIHRDLRRVIEVLPKRSLAGGGPPVTQPLVVFVDDLDRCSPTKVASIVEGINTFLAGDQPEFLFVIGMDPQMVAAALEHAHKDVKSYLPTYEQSVPLGWRFMDKFIQLAFTIPPRRTKAIENFVTALTKPVKVRPDAGAALSPALDGSDHADHVPAGQAHEQPQAAVSPEEAAIVQEAVSKTVTNESEDVLTILAGITQGFFCSPREIKRTLNFVRFVLLLRVGRLARGEVVPSLELYERWIVLCMRWPDMARWIQWGTDLPQSSPQGSTLEGLTAQRIGVMELAAAASATNVQEWGTVAASGLGLAENQVSWLKDSDLFRFFKNESVRLSADRLSQGASIGFY